MTIATQDGNFLSGSTWTGGTVPGPGDVADCGDFVVTIDGTVNCDGLTNSGSGHFLLASNQNVTAPVTFHVTGTAAYCVLADNGCAGSVFDGDVTNESTSGNLGFAIRVEDSITIHGDVYGGRATSGDDSGGIQLATTTAKVVVHGNVYEGTQTRNYAIRVQASVTYLAPSWQFGLTINGNVYKDQDVSNTPTIYSNNTSGAILVNGTVFASEGIHEIGTIDTFGHGSGATVFAECFWFDDDNKNPARGRWALLPGGKISLNINEGNGVYRRVTLSELTAAGMFPGAF